MLPAGYLFLFSSLKAKMLQTTIRTLLEQISRRHHLHFPSSYPSKHSISCFPNPKLARNSTQDFSRATRNLDNSKKELTCHATRHSSQHILPYTRSTSYKSRSAPPKVKVFEPGHHIDLLWVTRYQEISMFPANSRSKALA